jgi:C4-dicarboxylate-specific signal transduction histidine kinase
LFVRLFHPEPQRVLIGLGLAIARAIVEGYGGAITAANRSEGGAVFEVRLHRAPHAMTQSV